MYILNINMVLIGYVTKIQQNIKRSFMIGTKIKIFKITRIQLQILNYRDAIKN